MRLRCGRICILFRTADGTRFGELWRTISILKGEWAIYCQGQTERNFVFQTYTFVTRAFVGGPEQCLHLPAVSPLGRHTNEDHRAISDEVYARFGRIRLAYHVVNRLFLRRVYVYSFLTPYHPCLTPDPSH